MKLKRVIKLAFLFLFIPFCAGARTYYISFGILGVDNITLRHKTDFELSILKDGLPLAWSKYVIKAKDINQSIIEIEEDSLFKVIRVEITASGYKLHSANILASSFVNNKIDLGKITLIPTDFMIHKIMVYDSTDNLTPTKRLNFEITFKNNYKKQILIQQLSVNQSTSSYCSNPVQEFAVIEVDQTIFIENKLLKDSTRRFSGSITTDAIKKTMITGKINYDACGPRLIELYMPVSIVVPADKYSKMIFSLPYRLSADFNPANKRKNVLQSLKVKSLGYVFSEVGNIEFTITTDLERNNVITRRFNYRNQ